MKIVVLAGGISTERTVSLVSGTGVCQALRRKGHQAILVDMFMGLENPPADLNTLFDAPDGLCPDVKIEVQAPDLDVVRRSRPDQSPSRIGPHVLDICRLADIVFLGLHGQDGEDGRIQATLDLLGVPYTGAGYLGSAIAMDKIAAKEMMDANGIPNPKWQKLTYTEEEIPQLAETLPMPCVVKAPTGGSSLGVYLPKDRAELADALRQVRSFCHEVLVEQRIYGRELTDAVLGERYLPPVETFPSVENFDYEAKYQAGGAKEICPAELTEEALYTSFQIFAEERNLLDRWDAAAGAYLFSEEQICAVLDRYYEGYTFRIEDDPQYDPARQAIAAQVIGGFGGGTHVRVLEIRADGSVCTIRGSVLDGNDAPLGQKEYVLDFYDGGFYIRAVRALPDGDHG